MGGNPSSIVVGGGIALGSPATVGAFVKLLNITPPTANTSNRLREDATSIIAEGDEPGSTAIGENAEVVAGGARTVAIGFGARSLTTIASLASVLIGEAVVEAVNSGGSNVAIGRNVTLPDTAGGAVVIGGGIALTAVGSSVVIGGGAAVNAGSAVVVGASASGTGNAAVAIGPSASAQAGGVAVGSGAAAAINSVIVGNLSTMNSASQDCVIIGAGTGVGANNNVVKLGRSNGQLAFAVGDILLGNSATSPAGNRSTTLVLGGSRDVSQSGFNVGGPAFGVIYANSIGADQAAGDASFTAPRGTGTGAGGDFVFLTAPAGAAGSAVNAAQEAVRIGDDGLLTLSRQVDGAAAAAGTLGNAPVAGDPSFWMQITVNGVQRHIPCW